MRPCRCAVSDVRLSELIIVSEFTSGNVARVQRHAAVARGRRLCAVGADAYISPTNLYVTQRGDVGIAPYKLSTNN